MIKLNSPLVFALTMVLLFIVLFDCGSNDYSFARHQLSSTRLNPIPNPNFSYNNESIPLYNYSGFGPQINPLLVAVEVIQHARDSTPTDLEIVLNNADWLIENSVPVGNSSGSYNFSLLFYNFPAPAYNVAPPWTSAMAQARAISAMVDASNVTNEVKYLEAAKRFLNSLFVDVRDGGVTYKSGNGGGWWYEEYVLPTGNESKLETRVLNGMMTTLIDLYKYYNATGDENGKYLFDKGVVALKNRIGEYDINIPNILKHYEINSNVEAKALLEKEGLVTLDNNNYQYRVNASDIEGYSFYDTLGRLAGENYHKYHIELLSNLLNITNDEILWKYYDKWKSYSGPFAKVRLA